MLPSWFQPVRSAADYCMRRGVVPYESRCVAVRLQWGAAQASGCNARIASMSKFYAPWLVVPTAAAVLNEQIQGEGKPHVAVHFDTQKVQEPQVMQVTTGALPSGQQLFAHEVDATHRQVNSSFVSGPPLPLLNSTLPSSGQLR